MEVMSAREAADRWGISQRRVAVLCSENRIANAQMLGNMWLIPTNAEKPIDARSTRYNITDEKNLRAVSEKLQNVRIVCGDYRTSAEFIDEHTFVYFDPPYRPLTETASFTAYTENLFNDEEQIELAEFVECMHKKGAKVVVSNSDKQGGNYMNLAFDNGIIENYHSEAQIARVLTENWVNQNMYCPRCGNLHIKHFGNNRPVADFYCPSCNNEYELKSKDGNLGHKVNDGAYSTMIERITSNNNPDFFFMSYSKKELRVNNFILILKHFFVPDIIEKRKPLAMTARRAGWIGCNILIDKIPEQGIIDIVSNGEIINIKSVVDKVRKSNQLETKDINSRGWLMDILNCVNKISSQLFTLDIA